MPRQKSLPSPDQVDKNVRSAFPSAKKGESEKELPIHYIKDIQSKLAELAGFARANSAIKLTGKIKQLIIETEKRVIQYMMAFPIEDESGVRPNKLRASIKRWVRAIKPLLELTATGDGFTKALITEQGFQKVVQNIPSIRNGNAEDFYPYYFGGGKYPLKFKPALMGPSDFPILSVYLRALLTACEKANDKLDGKESRGKQSYSAKKRLVQNLAATFERNSKYGKAPNLKTRSLIQKRRIEYIHTIINHIGHGITKPTIERLLREPPVRIGG